MFPALPSTVWRTSTREPVRPVKGSPPAPGQKQQQQRSAEKAVRLAEPSGQQGEKRREKYLTAKYGSHQMALIRKRLKVEIPKPTVLLQLAEVGHIDRQNFFKVSVALSKLRGRDLMKFPERVI